MSLDVDLIMPGTSGPLRWTIFIRENGQQREVTLDEWNARSPELEPVLCRVGGDDTVYSANITHNLGPMASGASIYHHLWRPDEIGITKAEQLIFPLTVGLNELKTDPPRFKAMNPENGWGNYELLVNFVEEYLAACEEYPEAHIRADR